MPSPFSIASVTTEGKLDLECYISTSKIIVNNDGSFDNYGRWLDINDNKFYKIAKGSFDEAAVTFRRDEVVNPFLEGAYTVNALRENVMLNLQIQVRGETTLDVADAVTALTDALGQVTFKLQVVVENAQWIYNCYASDYSVQTPQEMLHARMAIVKATIPHDPVVSLSEVL